MQSGKTAMIFNIIVYPDFKIFAYGQSGISLPVSENLFTEELLVKMSFYNVIGFCMGYYLIPTIFLLYGSVKKFSLTGSRLPVSENFFVFFQKSKKKLYQ